MTLDALMEDAFLLGTGISRRKALASERHEELGDTFPRVPNLTVEQTVEMALLGEMLADRAFLTLPHRLRAKATQWSTYGDDEQVALLHELKEALGDKSLQHRQNRRRRPVNKPEDRALPHQYKSWVRNPARPSCLGLAQMLVGFGKATGAPCMLVDVLVPHHIYTAQFQYLRLQRLTKLLDAFTKEQPRFKRYRRIIQSSMEGTLDILAAEQEQRQAHHALAIKAASKWWLVDPYFDTIRPLDIKVKSVDRLHNHVRKAPRKTGIQSNSWSFERAFIDHRLTILEEALSYMHRLEEPRTSWTYIDASLTPLIHTNIFHKIKNTEESEGDYREALGTSIILTLYTLRGMRAMTDKHPGMDPSDMTDTYKRRAMQNKRYRNQVYLRTMRTLVFECLVAIVRLPDTPGLPKKQEFVHPTFQLAVRTVNQLAFERGVDAAELSLYSSSQWIFHDTLDAVRRSTSNRLQRHANLRIRAITKNPEHALPEINHLLESA